MINLRGVIYTDLQDLEAYMEAQNIPADQRQVLRDEFNGVPVPPPTQLELDRIRYSKRADAISRMLAEMAAENMDRIRMGVWTVPQLISLTQDAQIKEILTDIYSLSFEIAYSKVDGVTNPLITSSIKTIWKAKLAANFF